MRTKAFAIVAVMALSLWTTTALNAQRGAAASSAPTLKGPLRDAAEALVMLRGAEMQDSISTMEFWATGTMNVIPQGYKPGTPLPAFKITAYHGAIGYDRPGGMRVDFTRTGPDGTMPEQQIHVVAGQYAWNEAKYGMNATPAMETASDRLLQLWMTPAGVVKAARDAGDRTKVSTEGSNTVLTFPVGTTMMKATLNARNLIDRVEARVNHPVLGDTVLEATYSDYGDWNEAGYKSDVMFPKHIVQRVGGLPLLNLTITKTNTQNPYVVFPIPENVEKAAAERPATPRP
jgi:hypothetical protein